MEAGDQPDTLDAQSTASPPSDATIPQQPVSEAQPPEPGAYAYPQVHYPQVQYPPTQYPPTQYPQVQYPPAQYPPPYGQAPYPPASYTYDPHTGALYPAPHPPAPVRKRSRLRPLWIALAYVVPFAVLLGTAALVTPIVFPAPIVGQVRLEGPATVEELAELLQAPAGTAEGEPEVLQLADEAKAFGPVGGSPTRARIAERGYRWSVRLPWTGTDGSEGWLRLAQFRTVKGAQEHHRELLAHASDRHGEEWSVPDAPRASVFTYDTFATGYVAHAVFGKGTVAAEASISHADQDAHEDLMALIYDVLADLPGDLWAANRPEVQPVDVAAFVMPPPQGMRLARPVRTFGLVETAKILYADPEGAEDFLISLGHKRSAEAEFRRGLSAVYVTIMRFDSDYGSHTWFDNDSNGLADLDPYRTGDIPRMVNGAYFLFRTGGVITHGYAVFRKAEYGVQIFTSGAPVSTSDNLVSLAQTQFDLLPA